MLTNLELEQILDTKLNAKQIADYAPNGLQVEGRKHIQKIVTGVTATFPLIEKAIELMSMRFWCITATFGKVKHLVFVA